MEKELDVDQEAYLGAKSNLSGFSTMNEGKTYPLDELWKFHERLKGVKILRLDWQETLKRFDNPNTLFFIDPPYENEWAEGGHGKGIPAENIAEAVSKLKGEWVVAYTNSATARRSLSKVGHMFTLRFLEARNHGVFAKRRRLFASNCIEKYYGIDLVHEIDYYPQTISTDASSITSGKIADTALPDKINRLIQHALEKRIPLVKTKEERYVLGIVLEPETVDAQKDIYSAAEIRSAAHGFMENFARIGLMHRAFVDGDVKILESYIAPVTLDLDGTNIKKGTWLLAVRIVSDDLWRKVKSGELSGFSIGGSASRNPE